jgi:ASC-1-like (ASCH) protein
MTYYIKYYEQYKELLNKKGITKERTADEAVSEIIALYGNIRPADKEQLKKHIQWEKENVKN